MEPIADATVGEHSIFLPIRDPVDGRISPPPSYFDIFPQIFNNQAPRNVNIHISEPVRTSNIQPVYDQNSRFVYDPSTGTISIQNGSRSANQVSNKNGSCWPCRCILYGFFLVFLILLKLNFLDL